jgi:hypothetical protein
MEVEDVPLFRVLLHIPYPDSHHLAHRYGFWNAHAEDF